MTRPKATEAVEITVFGDVQGVNYRHFVWLTAQRCKVGGFVRNHEDGTVRARLVGTPAAIDKMLAEMRRGPQGARVDKIEGAALGPAEPEDGFTIKIAI